MKCAGKLVVHASRTHFLKRGSSNFQEARAAARLVPLEQEVKRRGMRKFWRTAKSAVATVKHTHDGFDLIFGHARIEFSARARACFRLRHGFGQARPASSHLSPPIPQPPTDLF